MTIFDILREIYYGLMKPGVMNEKQIISVILALFFFQAYGQMKIGIKAGLGICDTKFDVDEAYGANPDSYLKLGIHAGVVANFPLLPGEDAEVISFQPGILLTSKGYNLDIESVIKEEFETQNISIYDYGGYFRMNYTYFELPLNLVIRSGGFHLLFGPYIAIAVMGRLDIDFDFRVSGIGYTYNKVSVDDRSELKPVYGKVDDDEFRDFLNDSGVAELFRGFDWGANVGIGYRINKVLINLGYSHGLQNMTPRYDLDEIEIDDEVSDKMVQMNRVYRLSLTYFVN
jgi:hypothetical protein